MVGWGVVCVVWVVCGVWGGGGSVCGMGDCGMGDIGGGVVDRPFFSYSKPLVTQHHLSHHILPAHILSKYHLKSSVT
jgi:hypothetical protein